VATQSFFEVAHDLLVDPDAKSAFGDDPQGFLTSRGLGDLSREDLHDAAGFVAESLPPPAAESLWIATSNEDAPGHPLAKLVELDPTVVEVPDLPGFTHLASHELLLEEDLMTTELPPRAEADVDEGESEAEETADDAHGLVGAEHDIDGHDEDESDMLSPVSETSSGAAYGVGYGVEDIDDVSPPTVHEGEMPVGFEMPALTDPVPHEEGHDGDPGLDLDLDF